MTQQYIVGELSILLSRLQVVAPDRARAADVGRLRHEAERRPVTELGSVVGRALKLTDQLCSESLEWGDTAAFARQAAMGSELCGFAVCAGLFDDTRVD